MRIIVLVGLVILGAWGGWAVYSHNRPVHHFGVVQPRALYRGGQPDYTALGEIVDGYGIRTVVNLRGPEPAQDWYATERRFCDDHGLKMVDIDIDDIANIRSNVRKFLDVATDAGNQPVFTHCEAGSARTGFAVAAYRIVAQGWSCEKALDDARRFNFKPEVHSNPRYVEVLRELAAGRSRISQN
ncbi:MAG: hypothetical protein GWP05_05645 [Anaerolineaceae bacterium]|nr:hypothetical protein [Anaerolineaceae bacterium]